MKRILLIGLMLTMKLSGWAQYQLDTIHYAGDSKSFIDIVFLGDGFTANELTKFEFYAKSHSAQLFDKTPLKQYQSMFNVFYVKTASKESGAGLTPSAPIDNFYGTCFGTAGVDRMPWPTKWNKVYEVLNKTKPEYDMVVIIVNKQKYGGGGGGGFICYSLDDSSIETLRHESGHALGGLSDEYWYQGWEAPNQTQNVTNVKWKNWMGDEGIGTYRYSNVASDEAYSWYRPHQDCLMRYLNREFCAVCREALIEAIHESSKNILSYSPSNSSQQEIEDAPMTFALNLLKPNPNTLRIKWMMDGKVIASNVDETTIKPTDYEAGQHTLSVSVEDTTLFVRKDAHASLHGTIVEWNIKTSASSGIKVVSDATASFKIEKLPFDTEIVISGFQQLKKPVKALLTDMNGRKVAQGVFDENDNCRINTAHLSSGVYLLQIKQKNRLLYSNKVVKR